MGSASKARGPALISRCFRPTHANLDVNVISVLRREWYVEDIAIDHPVVKLIVNKNGENNLPTLPESNSQSNTNAFDLGIRPLLLDRGEVYYNDRKTPLYADLHDLRLKSTYDSTDRGRYCGSLGYHDGHLKYGNYAPMTHGLQAQFDARRSGMQLNDVTLTTLPMIAKLNASIQNYSNPTAHANYSIILDGGELRRVLKDPSLPVGEVLVTGTADYANNPNQALLNSITVNGDVSSKELLLHTTQLDTAIRCIRGHYEVAAGNAEVRNLHASLLGGQITGNATIRDLAGKGIGRATLNLRSLSLASLKSLANTASLKQLSLRGAVNGKAEATWTGGMQNLLARTDATINSTAAPAVAAEREKTIPLNGTIHAVYNGTNQTIALNNTYIQAPQTTLNLNGTVSNHSALKVNLQANNLAELETIADIFRTPKPGEPPPQPLGLSGRLSFNGTVSRSIAAPELQGRLNGTNVQVHSASFKSLQADVDASPSQVAITNGRIEPAPQGQLNFNLQASLKDWSLTPNSPLAARVNANNVAVAPLLKAADVSTPISGTLNANIDVRGSEDNPIGNGRVSLVNANVSGQPIQAVNADLQGTGDVVNSNLLVRRAVPAGQSVRRTGRDHRVYQRCANRAGLEPAS